MTAHAQASSQTHKGPDHIPRVPLLMMAGVAVLALILAASTSLGLFPREAVPAESRAAAGTQAVAERDLHFRDVEGGAVVVMDASTGAEITRVEPGTGGFIRSTMRSLVHVRRAKDIGAAEPFRLTEWDDGGLTLSDPATGESIELVGFGRDNRAVYAAMLEKDAE